MGEDKTPSFAVGDESRPRIGRAVFGALVLAAGAAGELAASKLKGGPLTDAPWTSDPYDVVASFGLLLVAPVAAAAAIRTPLCRRAEPLPAARCDGLLRAARLIVASAVVVAGAQVASLLLADPRGASPIDWFATAAIASGALGVTALLVRAGGLPACAEGPDWFDDLLATIASVLSRARAGQAGVDLSVGAISRVRRRPLLSAALLAFASGVALTAGQAAGEGVTPALSVFWVVACAGVFTLTVAAGRYLRISGASDPASARSIAAVAAGAWVMLASAFRAPLAGLTGLHAASPVDVDLLLIVPALAAGTAAYAAAARRRA